MHIALKCGIAIGALLLLEHYAKASPGKVTPTDWFAPLFNWNACPDGQSWVPVGPGTKYTSGPIYDQFATAGGFCARSGGVEFLGPDESLGNVTDGPITDPNDPRLG